MSDGPGSPAARRRFTLQSLVAFVLLLSVAIQAGRVLGLLGGARWDLGGREPGSLSPETRALLGSGRKGIRRKGKSRK